ncbi:MAG: hypothetical protein NVSMB66_7780 [Candidatus Doudnabacteria bacterium]
MTKIPVYEHLELILSQLNTSEKIAVLESLGKKYRRENSVRINHKQMGRRVDERPDEVNMKID